jgi:hypothetical protein
MHADRANRVLLSFLGLVALALGGAGLLAAGGAFGEGFAHRRLVDNRFSRYFSANGSWLWPTLAAVALVIMLLALIWLLRLLFSNDRTSDIAVASGPAQDAVQAGAGAPTGGGQPPGRAAGHTTLQASALAAAVAQEIEGYHGVAAARARVLGDPKDPTVAIDVTATRRADLPGLIERIEREAISHAREALERSHLPVRLDMAVTDKGGARAT